MRSTFGSLSRTIGQRRPIEHDPAPRPDVITARDQVPIGAVAALQTVLVVTGICVTCMFYGLHRWLPTTFDRFVVRISGQECGSAGTGGVG